MGIFLIFDHLIRLLDLVQLFPDLLIRLYQFNCLKVIEIRNVPKTSTNSTVRSGVDFRSFTLLNIGYGPQ